MSLSEKIKDLIEDQGFNYIEKSRTIHTTCPVCNRSDKFSILKDNGSCICYHGSCDFGRRWFDDWLSIIADIPRKEATEKIKGPKISPQGQIKLPEKKKPTNVELEPTEWPKPGFYNIDEQEATEGALYLEKRGIPIELAKLYDIRYSPWYRRVILPIKMNNETYGWQARAIDVVHPSERMRNNPGFRRELLLMFCDTLKNNSTAMIFEGPFDALKFHSYGGIVCTMGKNVSNMHIKIINDSNVEEVYLGLDPDAAEEMRYLSRQFTKKVKVLSIPQSCIDRCIKENKKPDYGECTPSEIEEAFKNAKDLSSGHIFIHLKKKY